MSEKSKISITSRKDFYEPLWEKRGSKYVSDIDAEAIDKFAKEHHVKAIFSEDAHRVGNSGVCICSEDLKHVIGTEFSELEPYVENSDEDRINDGGTHIDCPVCEDKN